MKEETELLREGWNFKNDIGLPLESIARRFYRNTDRPFGKIYDSDSIETGSFIEVMVILLREKTQYTSENDSIEAFVNKCTSLFGKSGHDISPEVASELFKEFTELFGEL